MKSLLHKIIRASVAAGLSLLALTNASAQEDSVGIVRITKPKSGPVMAQQVTPASFNHGRIASTGDCHSGQTGQQSGDQCQTGNCPSGQGDCRSHYRADWRTADWSGDCWGASLRQRTQGHCFAMEQMWCNKFNRGGPDLYYHDDSGQAMCDYFRCKFGYFIPTGAGGAGVPWVGKYSRVYPQDPHYFDQRDGQAYAAQGYGAPIAVPLAPVVGHTYNYGWGIPSSRLTPVSRPAY